MSNGFENMPHQDGFEIWMDLDPHFSRLFWLRLVWNLSRQPGTSPQHRSRRCWGSPSRDFWAAPGGLVGKCSECRKCWTLNSYWIHHNSSQHEWIMQERTKEGMNEQTSDWLEQAACSLSRSFWQLNHAESSRQGTGTFPACHAVDIPMILPQLDQWYYLWHSPMFHASLLQLQPPNRWNKT